MVTYVVGDIHGHLKAFDRLLARLPLDPDTDSLWLVGDLVNRGPDSPGVLRRARQLEAKLGPRFMAVLGNHDVHLLALAEGLAEMRPRDTLEDVLGADDRDELVAWLGRRPIFHRRGEHLLVHAGLRPEWTPDEAEDRARRVEAWLADLHGRRALLPRQDPSELPAQIRPDPRALRRLEGETAEVRADFQTFVRLRTLTADGEPCDFSGAPEEAPPGCIPWFRIPERRSAGSTALFGHWAALGLHREPGVYALDSGCAWEGCLTALRLEDGEIFQTGCSG